VKYRYSPKDYLLAVIAIFQPILMTIWCLNFNLLSLIENILLVFAGSLLFYFNPIVITHNFLHYPFFRNKKVNQFFEIFNSANLLLPQILYKYHHLTHHTYSNDPAVNGVTKDPSSTYRYGKNGLQENMIRYCLLSLFRDGTTMAYFETRKRKQMTNLVLQIIAIISVLIFWSYLNFSWMLLGLFPVFFFGWFLAHMENYYEHFLASKPGNRFGNSVTYPGRYYNIVMFNEGYHQEHHIEPSAHWSKRPAIRETYDQSLRDVDSYITRFPPLLGFLDSIPKSKSSHVTSRHVKTIY